MMPNGFSWWPLFLMSLLFRALVDRRNQFSRGGYCGVEDVSSPSRLYSMFAKLANKPMSVGTIFPRIVHWQDKLKPALLLVSLWSPHGCVNRDKHSVALSCEQLLSEPRRFKTLIVLLLCNVGRNSSPTLERPDLCRCTLGLSSGP